MQSVLAIAHSKTKQMYRESKIRETNHTIDNQNTHECNVYKIHICNICIYLIGKCIGFHVALVVRIAIQIHSPHMNIIVLLYTHTLTQNHNTLDTYIFIFICLLINDRNFFRRLCSVSQKSEDKSGRDSTRFCIRCFEYYKTAIEKQSYEAVQKNLRRHKNKWKTHIT